MIRKSLALGAGVALAATGLTAAPAQAVATGELWSAYGQTNEMVGVAGHKFTLKLAKPGSITAGSESTTGTGASDADEATAQGLADAVVAANDDNDAADARATVAGSVTVSWVAAGGKTAPTINVVGADTPSPAISSSNTVNVAVDTTTTVGGETYGADLDAGAGFKFAATQVTSAVADGNVVIAAPSDLTYSMQLDVYVTYADGSRSETERVTFVPKDTVSTSVVLASVEVSSSSLKSGNSLSFSGINTANFLTSNAQAANPGADGDATSTNFGTSVTVGGDAVETSAWAYDVLTDSYTFGYTDAIVAGDVIIAKVNLWNGASVDANVFFDADATATEAKFTVAATDANAALAISTVTAGVVHNSTATATSLVTAETVVAPEGTKSLNFVIQALTGAGSTTAAGANIPITVSLKDDVAPANDLGTTTISSNGKTLDLTGSTVSFTLLTNSSGQVAFTVTADNAKAGESFDIDAANSIGDSITQTTVRWEEAAWTLIPAIDGNFTIAPKGSVAVDYHVINQFGTLAGADYQIAFTRAAGAGARDTLAEYANWSYVAPVSATGRASVTIVDNGAAATEGKDTVTATLQKAATAGGAYLAVAGSTDTFVLNYENDLSALTSTAKVNYNGIANAAGTAVAPIYLETDPLVNYDSRLSTDRTAVTKWSQYNYDDDGVVVAGTNSADAQLRLYGTVVTTGNAPVAGVAVKLSAAGLNFADNAAVGTMTRASNDSFVVFTDATGSYEAFVRSATTGNVTIAVDAQGATSSVEVRFENSTGVATGLTLVGPTSVASGARADFTATVVDKFGKPVSGVNVTFKDNGPGVLNTTAAVATDAFGEAQATLTTLAAERGTTVVTAYATIGGVLVTQTATITVGASAAAADGKVNVGSFNGKLVVYALGLDGAKISWKVAGRWGTAVASGDALNRFDRPVGASGRNVIVEIYVNGVRQLQKTVLTR